MTPHRQLTADGRAMRRLPAHDGLCFRFLHAVLRTQYSQTRSTHHAKTTTKTPSAQHARAPTIVVSAEVWRRTRRHTLPLLMTSPDAFSRNDRDCLRLAFCQACCRHDCMRRRYKNIADDHYATRGIRVVCSCRREDAGRSTNLHREREPSTSSNSRNASRVPPPRDPHQPNTTNSNNGHLSTSPPAPRVLGAAFNTSSVPRLVRPPLPPGRDGRRRLLCSLSFIL